MKKIHIIMIIIFFAMIAILILTMNHQPEQASEIDNRMLTELSDIESGNRKQGIEDYLSDRIGLRDEMIDIYTVANDKLFNVMIHPSYVYGKDGWVFFPVGYENRGTEFMDVFIDFTKKMDTYSTDRGAKFLFCWNPTKREIYEEYLPEGVNYERFRTNYILSGLKNNNVNMIDNTPALMKEKEKRMVFNKKYDAGHWNEDGAIAGLANIYKELQKDFPQIPDLDRDDYTVERVHYDTLMVSQFRMDDWTNEYTPKNLQSKRGEIQREDVEISQEHQNYFYYKNESRPDLPKLLFFRGSYMNGKNKFIADHFSEAVMVHNYGNIEEIDYYFNIFQPDIVLFETAEYAANETLFDMEDMQSKVLNPAYPIYYKDLPEAEFEAAGELDAKAAALRNKENDKVITTLNVDLYLNATSYAYLEMDGVYYDFKKQMDAEEASLKISLKTSDILDAQKMNIMLISMDQKSQQIIPIN